MKNILFINLIICYQYINLLFFCKNLSLKKKTDNYRLLNLGFANKIAMDYWTLQAAHPISIFPLPNWNHCRCHHCYSLVLVVYHSVY